MVKREPNIIRGRLVEFVWIGYIVFGAFYVFTRQPAYSNPFIMVLGYAFIGLLNIGAGIAQVRFWRKQDMRRQQSANGDQNLTAGQQPVLSDTTLMLPATIVQRTAKGWLIVLVVAAVLVAAIILLLLLLSFGAITLLQNTRITDGLVILFVCLLMLAVFALVVASPILRGNQTLIVYEYGISVRIGFGRTHHIKWDEAKLFAISAFYKAGYSVSSINMEMRRLPEYYEVSSINDVVRWRWVRTHSFIAVEPTLPIAEYDRQMQALLSFVATKTGLMLYDVRPREQRL